MKWFMRALVPLIAWPGLMGVCLATTALGFALDAPVVGFNATYLGLAAALYVLERWIPHERQWIRPDGQLLADLSHTLLSNGIIQVLIVFSARSASPACSSAPGTRGSPSGRITGP